MFAKTVFSDYAPHHISAAGWRGSFQGDLQMYGKMGVQFFTRTKTVTQSWKDAAAAGGAIPGLAGVGE